jgi:hypothetical protein
VADEQDGLSRDPQDLTRETTHDCSRWWILRVRRHDHNVSTDLVRDFPRVLLGCWRLLIGRGGRVGDHTQQYNRSSGRVRQTACNRQCRGGLSGAIQRHEESAKHVSFPSSANRSLSAEVALLVIEAQRPVTAIKPGLRRTKFGVEFSQHILQLVAIGLPGDPKLTVCNVERNSAV